MSKKKGAALVAVVDGQWKVSLHDNIERANDYGGKMKDLEDGWAIETREHFDEIFQDPKGEPLPDKTVAQRLQAIHDIMGPKPDRIPKDIDKAREQVWIELSKDLVAGELPAAEEPTPETNGEESVEDAEDLVEPEEEEQVQTATETSTKKAGRAPPKAVAGKGTTSRGVVAGRAAPRAAAAKPAAKPAPAARAAPKAAARAAPKAAAAKPAAANGAKRSIGEAGVSDPWKKVLKDIGKKGDTGATSAEIAVMCEKHGVRPYYARFSKPVTAGGKGYLARVEQGKYKITASGKKVAGVE